MKNIFYRLPMILIMALVFSSCEDFLEEMPQNRLEPSTIEDYRELLNKAYILDEKVTPYIEALSDDAELIEANHAYGMYNNNPLPDMGDNMLSAYMYHDSHEFSLSGGDIAFERFYESIFYCNVVIEKIDDAISSTVGVPMTDVKNNIKGEAYALRAFSYFYLVNLYGKWFDPESAETDFGIPVTTSTGAEDKPYPRASVKDVYDQITSDIEQAISLMETNPLEKNDKRLFDAFRIKAFASRVALYMHEWDQTIAISTDILGENSNIFDLRDAISFANEENNNSSSATVLSQGQDYLDINNNNVIFVNGTNEIYPLLSVWVTNTTFSVNTDLAEIYEDGDVRRYYFMGTYRRSLFGINFEKLLPFKHRSTTYPWPLLDVQPTFFDGYTRVVRVEEVLLNRAEAYAQIGELQLAVNDLNTLREKKFDPALFTQLSAGSFTQESLLTFIYAERRKELCFEGHRWFDLRRTTRPAITGRIGYDGETASLQKDDPRYILQIPEKELDTNPSIERAPR